jgi:exodeoxyribonuclease-3
MKLVSWNVNGIRSAIKQGFFDFIESEKADIYLLQEVKISEADLDEIPVPEGYHMFYFLPEKKGYAGLIVYSKDKPKDVVKGLEVEILDLEARVMVLEYDGFFLLNVYFPHSRRDLARIDFKLEFNDIFMKYVKELETKKPVVIGGDFNVAHESRDLANPKQNEKNAGFTIQERKWFDEFLKAGFIDTFRMFESENGHYTWWSNRKGVRERNVGWRIDYLLVSKQLEKKVRYSKILDKVYGSDHCPIEADMEL